MASNMALRYRRVGMRRSSVPPSNDPTYDSRITENEVNLALAGGTLDSSNPANPFKDWTKVFIPYCTGDVGWGNQDATYATPMGPLTVRHRGYANVKAVLRWIEDGLQQCKPGLQA